MEIIEILAFFCVFWIGAGFALVMQWLIMRKALAIARANYGVKGREAMRETNSRMAEAVAEAVAMYQEKKDIKEIASVLLAKYPDIAMQLGSKLLKGKIKGLGGLLGGAV